MNASFGKVVALVEQLKARIAQKGVVLPGGIIKVDAFLNHQIDPLLADAIADEFARRFADEGVSKVLTIEASGIAFAILTALKLRVPLLFAKKQASRNLGQDGLYTAQVHSFTKDVDNTIVVNAQYLRPEDRVLVVDDFMAMGEAALGLCSLVGQAGASLAGVGIVIEKGFQPGGALLRAKGIRVESLAIIQEVTPEGTLVFA